MKQNTFTKKEGFDFWRNQISGQLILLYVCLYIVMIGYGLSLPTLPFFLQELAENSPVTSVKLSLHIGAITAVFAFAQMIFAPLWGKLSDRLGKRKVLLAFGLAGYGISMALAGMAESIRMLYVARILNGIFAAAVLPLASAYIVDVLPEKKRARGLAWHGTAVGLGVVTGPALGAFVSWLTREYPIYLGFINVNSFSSPFFLGSILAFIALIIATVWLPESSLPAKKISIIISDKKKPAGGGSFIKSSLANFLLLSLVSQFALSLFEGTFVLHAQSSINIDVAQLGAVFMVCGFVMAAAQGTTVAGFIEKFGAERILPFGFIFMGLALAALMVAESMYQILLVVGVLALGMAVVTPSIAFLVSQGAEDCLGNTLGQLTGANSLGQTIGPLVGSMLFVYNRHLPYLLTSGILLLAAGGCFLKRGKTS